MIMEMSWKYICWFNSFNLDIDIDIDQFKIFLSDFLEGFLVDLSMRLTYFV